jgi:putative transposase
VERVFRFIRDAFLNEAVLRKISTFQELNDTFTAWVAQACNTRLHAETDQTPAKRFATLSNPRRPDPELLYEAFRWSVVRTVSRTAQVSLAGLKFQVDGALCSQRVELHFDPDDLSRIDVWFQGRRCGAAIPFVLGRHVQRQAPPAPVSPPEPTGIDYLGLLEQQHLRESIGRLSYRDLQREDPS